MDISHELHLRFSEKFNSTNREFSNALWQLNNIYEQRTSSQNY